MKPVEVSKEHTTDAFVALEKTGMSRRQFIARSGALIVGFSMAGLTTQLIAPGSAAAQRLDGAGSSRLDSWIAIGGDGSVTAYTGKCELGQGLYNAQMQLIAEELCVPFDRVKLIQCDTALTPDQGTTSGAQSHPTNFNNKNLALACATAREALLQRASAQLGVPVDRLAVKDGVIRAQSDSSKSVTYAELIGGRTFDVPLDPRAKRKHPSEWTVLGKPVPREEIPTMVAGQFEFVHNVRVPGMLHGQVVRPPAVGATLVGVEDASVRGIPGIVKVVVKKNFVGVVAEKPWQALQAANKLKVTWTPGTGLPPQRDFYEYLRNQKPTRDTFLLNSKDVDEKLSSAAKIVHCGEGRESYVPLPLPNAWIGGQLVCGWRCQGRQSDDLVGDAGGLSAEKQHRNDPRPDTRECARHFQTWVRLLRYQRRGHGFL